MKKFTIILLMLVASVSFAQNAPIDFEPGVSVTEGMLDENKLFSNTSREQPENIIINGDFDNGLNSWTTFVASWIPVAADFAEVDGEAAITNITGAGGEVWFVQFNQLLTAAQINALVVGETYKIQFDARSNVNGRQLRSYFGEEGGGFTALKISDINLSTSMETYEAIFVVTQTFGAMKLGFEMGLSNDDVFIDNVSLTLSENGGPIPPPVPAGLVASNMIGPNPVGPGEIFLACGPNNVGGNVVYKMFYSETTSAPEDPTTATEYIFGTTAGDGGGLGPFGFVVGGLMLGTNYSFWLYQYDIVSELYSDGFATASATSGDNAPTEPTVAAPTPPERESDDVVSIFSHAYMDVEGTDFNPGWGQSTVVTFVEIEGNETMKYAKFNYQGTQFGSALNLASMEHMHLDMWTADATTVNISLISPGPVETAYALPITLNGWASYNIPLTAFADVDLTNVIQMKFDGGNGSQTLYLDNIYFYTTGGGVIGDPPRNPIDFEAGGYGADWTWTVFENGPNAPLEIITNPVQSGINTSATIAKFTALQIGAPWAGCESAHGDDDLGPFVLDATNSLIKIMVWKPVISDVGIKLVTANGWSVSEIKVANTLVNQWEELTFDFSAVPNPPVSEGQYDKIVIFPDFNLSGRTQDNVIYFDNITFNPAGTMPEIPTVAAPTPPERAPGDVISLFSDAYANVPVDTWLTPWSAALLQELTIEGNPTKRYYNLNFAGIETIQNQLNLTEMLYLHMDVWSPNFTLFGIKLVDLGPDGAFGGGDDSEHQVNFPGLPQREWISLDIPLSDFTGLNSLNNIAQYILVGQPTGFSDVYIDNIYFYRDATELYINNETFSADFNDCIGAENFIEVSNTIVESGANLVLIAGQYIKILQNTHIESGSEFLARIDTDGSFCDNFKSILAAADIEPAQQKSDDSFLASENKSFIIYPNPTNGHFTLEFINSDNTGAGLVEIYSMIGELVLSRELSDKQSWKFDLADKAKGIYIIRVVQGSEIETRKVVKQ